MKKNFNRVASSAHFWCNNLEFVNFCYIDFITLQLPLTMIVLLRVGNNSDRESWPNSKFPIEKKQTNKPFGVRVGDN